MSEIDEKPVQYLIAGMRIDGNNHSFLDLPIGLPEPFQSAMSDYFHGAIVSFSSKQDAKAYVAKLLIDKIKEVCSKSVEKRQSRVVKAVQVAKPICKDMLKPVTPVAIKKIDVKTKPPSAWDFTGPKIFDLREIAAGLDASRAGRNIAEIQGIILIFADDKEPVYNLTGYNVLKITVATKARQYNTRGVVFKVDAESIDERAFTTFFIGAILGHFKFTPYCSVLTIVTNERKSNWEGVTALFEEAFVDPIIISGDNARHLGK